MAPPSWTTSSTGATSQSPPASSSTPASSLAVRARRTATPIDAYDDRYVSFLLTEIVPQVAHRYAITDDSERWGICGGSNGGNCAFTAAWLRPDKFRKVIGYLSSFTQMPGGNPYPEDIARTPPKRLCASSCKRATATWAGTNRRGTGSPTIFVSRLRSQKPGTTSVSSSATAAITQTTVVSSSLTLSAGHGARNKSEPPVRREYCHSDGRRAARRWRHHCRVEG